MPLHPDYENLGYDIIASAFEVKKFSGRKLREKYYEAALAYELRQRGHHVMQQAPLNVKYKGLVISDPFYADLVVDNKVLIELKTLPYFAHDELRQLNTYLYLTGFKLGYLINFGTPNFCVGKIRDEYSPYRKGIYRLVNNI